ncbi:vomeronasal type-2 receptor 26 [Xenopus laevis]|uniref:Vomeronasal type-2 receptor 26 n=1 Tax=Xenopus laevis TaxID=8355 RepID=A0A8J0U6C6_XENLA|nr:vomeronasal type-2 receptor 26 [Xenopus laevis]
MLLSVFGDGGGVGDPAFRSTKSFSHLLSLSLLLLPAADLDGGDVFSYVISVHYFQTLKSQCSASCPPGYRKVPQNGAPPCCYDCASCSEGEVSNLTDMENCVKCPDYKWPNHGKTLCLEKPLEFLSYDRDPLTLIFNVITLILFLISLSMLGIFISFRDTPVVKANNRNLSFLLLFTIKLSFLSVFLFLGHPVDITCMLRQTSFAITFSTSVSCVLAKTIMVCIAFKASKPGSSWRKWMGPKEANYIAFVCSVIQIVISVIWLVISPPFAEQNIHSKPGIIIIQCNEGSVVAFYIVLSYMGLLASVSFIVAFLARTLPDSFNEAKYITFSMLLFCSVWITMIPAYLSTKGKYMVAVEIFAIISSNCGLLFCIFLPKCYIILLKPEINTKQYLLRNKQKITESL